MSSRTGQGIVSRRRNAVAAWLLVACLAAATLASASAGDLLWAGFGVAAIAVVVVPSVAYRRWTATLPWEVLAFVALPFAGQPLGLLPRPAATFLVVPALALAIVVEFDAFTAVEMSPGFAVLFAVTTTMATAGAWAVVQWVADLTLGTQNLTGLRQVMWSLVAATGAGVVAGALFAAYFRRVDAQRLGFRTGESRERAAPPRTSDRASGRRLQLSDRRQQQLVRAFQLALVAVLFVGVARASVGIVVNAGVALVLLELPGVLERNYRLPIDTGLLLWIVVPVFLHAIGTVGLYQSIGLWDQLTHAMSASLVAAAGYTTVRAFDVHYEDVYLPQKFVAAFILLFTLAFGVLWELLEFALDGLASATGTESVLAQYSLANTMLDLVFDAVGGGVVALWGAAHLSDVSQTLAARLTAERESE